MSEVVGIKENNTNQISYVYTENKYAVGDMLVIDNGKGEYLYSCVRDNETFNPNSHKIIAIKNVRRATSSEILRYINAQQKVNPFYEVFEQMKKELNVNADLISIDVSLDEVHLKYTYYSIDKLNFPQLIKYLLMHNPSRKKIEFYQVGEREYYAINGGMGVCGYELCCHSRSHHTPTITTNSLTNLGINISLKKTLTGTCGKYKCCLLFDIEDKGEISQKIPDLDQKISYCNEQVVVTSINLKKQQVTVMGSSIIHIDFAYFMKGTDDCNK